LQRILLIGALFLSLANCSQEIEKTSTETIVRDIKPGQWDHYGGDLSGTRYVAKSKITPANVASLEQAWVYRTGDAIDAIRGKASSFKATPILFAGKLIFSTGLNKVHAISPQSGELSWKYDPELNLDISYSEQFTSRGVSAWSDPLLASSEACADRVYLGTLDSRLIALDARTGIPCKEFGSAGTIDLSTGANLGILDRRFRPGEYAVTSPPLVANDVVVVGSSIGDNGKTNLESGVVRGFDVRTGEELWQWDPIPKKESARELKLGRRELGGYRGRQCLEHNGRRRVAQSGLPSDHITLSRLLWWQATW